MKISSVNMGVQWLRAASDAPESQTQAVYSEAGEGVAPISTEEDASQSVPVSTEEDASQTDVVGDGKDVEKAQESDLKHEKKGAGSKNSKEAQDPREIALIEELKARDAQVKAHEQAHMAAGGAYAGAPSYSYTTGPDGKSYATGGEVSIDMSPVQGDPQATVQKMQTVQAAALAPADPSAQDRRVASEAARIAAQAQVEVGKMRSEQGPVGSKKAASKASEAGNSEKQNAVKESGATKSPQNVSPPETESSPQPDTSASRSSESISIASFPLGGATTRLTADFTQPPKYKRIDIAA